MPKIPLFVKIDELGCCAWDCPWLEDDGRPVCVLFKYRDGHPAVLHRGEDGIRPCKQCMAFIEDYY